MRLALDLDGVCFDFNQAYHDRLIKVTGENRFPKDWGVPCWDWDLYYGYTKQEIADTWASITKDRLFWRKLKPLPEPAVFARLNALSKTNDLYFLTNRMGVECKQQTEKALYELGISYPTVLIAGDKTPILKALKIDFFVDDKLETMTEVHFNSHSQGWATDKYFALIDAPYNQNDRPVNLKVAADLKTALQEIELW